MHNLPIPLNRFIGRQPEIAELQRLLSGSRLATLTGPGGCGKTRLALEVAANLVDTYADGVWWVSAFHLAGNLHFGLIPCGARALHLPVALCSRLGAITLMKPTRGQIP